MSMRLKEIIHKCHNEKRAIIAFNIQNLIQLEALFKTAENLMLPIIAQFSEKSFAYLDSKYSFLKIKAKYNSKYLFYHLDHSTNLETIKNCIKIGFDSVMFDGSSLAFEENLRLTQKVKAMAAEADCLLEAELGAVFGEEDGYENRRQDLVNLDELIEFVSKTNVDLLALGFGNAHGIYKNFDSLNLTLLSNANSILNNNQPFVLHGGSGLSDKIFQECIENGVVKINISTNLKVQTLNIMSKYCDHNKQYNEITFVEFMESELFDFFNPMVNKFTNRNANCNKSWFKIN